MNILVVGRGGREHSITMKLAESKRTNAIFAAPGNGGMDELATCVDIDEMDTERLVEFAKENQIDLTVVGPENPLLGGITNRFQDEGLTVFAPTKEAALIEGSKNFAKAFMHNYDIPTAEYATFTDANQAKLYIEEKGAPIVIKADGLAAGKGVVVAETKEEAIQAVNDMLVEKTFAEAGARIVIEECLTGKEFSLMAFVQGENVYPMIPARDHKRAFDNDEGPNTGGMGAYAPVADVSPEIVEETMEKVLKRAASGMVAEGRSFTGILYAGLMMTEQGPKVIEFNARFGDPETEVVLPLLKNDLVQVFQDVLQGNDPKLEWEEKSCSGVVLAAQGYPGSYEKNVPLLDLEVSAEAFVVQAGTKKEGTKLVSNGGRVLMVGATGTTLDEALERTYKCLKPYEHSDAFFYRKDIGRT